MKKCPYCAKEIDNNVKVCTYCGKSVAKKFKAWYFRNWLLLTAFLLVGPLALPLLWFNPYFNKVIKIIVSIIVLVLILYFYIKNGIVDFKHVLPY
jgi:hypothetical protein